MCTYIAGINTFIAVRGMMYYRRALKLQAFLDMASESGKPVHVDILSGLDVLFSYQHCPCASL